MKAKKQTQIINLRDLLTTFFKHRYKIIFTFIPIVIITIIISILQPVHYVAKSVIMIKPGREYTAFSDINVSEANRAPVIGPEAMLNTEMQLLTSHDLIKRVIDEVGIYNIYPDLKSEKLTTANLQNVAYAKFIEDLLVKPTKGNALEIFYRSQNPIIAAKATNALVKLLNDKHLEVYGEIKSPLILELLKGYDSKLKDAMNKLSDFKEKNNITSIKDQFYFIVGKRTDVENQLRMEESRLEELKNKSNFMKQQKTEIARVDLYEATARQRLSDLYQKETELLGTYKENSRPIRNIRAEIKTVLDTLQKYEAERKETGEWITIDADIAPQNLRIANIRLILDKLSGQLNELGAKNEQLNQLEREVANQQVNYEAYVKKYEDAKLSEEMDRKKITNIQIIETAAIPTTPVKANQRKVLGIGLFTAISLSLGLAFLFEMLPQDLTTPESVTKQLDLPVLVTIAQKG
jgi:polysaccharide biosynthesis protein PslE